MKVTTAEYHTSIAGNNPIMMEKAMQIAFLGRSNVGKSSLINAVTGRKSLARSSSSPGKTKRIYFYRINNAFYVVDLPGYGYAKVGSSKKADILRMIRWYINHEDYGVRKFVLLVDFKVGPTTDDIGMYEALIELEKNVVVVATKVDKIKKTHRPKQMKNIAEQLGTENILPVSVTKNIGIDQLNTLLF